MVRFLHHMTQQILSYFQMGVAILLGAVILLQQKGQGLSGAFGGEGGFYRTKRGLEKTLLIITVALAVTFIGISIFRVALSTTPESAVSLPEVQPPNMPSFELKTEPVVDGNTISVPAKEANTKSAPSN